MIHDKTCAYCLKEFKTSSKRQKYCNSICKEKNRKKDHRKIYKTRKAAGYYENNRISINKVKNDYRKKRVKEHQLIFRELKQGPCFYCGKLFHFSAMDFHHRDSKDKEKDISIMVKHLYSIERIKKELAKCVLVCSNCHRIHHYFERQGMTLLHNFGGKYIDN